MTAASIVFKTEIGRAIAHYDALVFDQLPKFLKSQNLTENVSCTWKNTPQNWGANSEAASEIGNNLEKSRLGHLRKDWQMFNALVNTNIDREKYATIFNMAKNNIWTSLVFEQEGYATFLQALGISSKP